MHSNFNSSCKVFGSLAQRQDAILRGATETLGSAGSSASASVAKSLESAARILKTPDVFEASDSMSWVTWRHSFLNWLSYADSRFLDSIRDIEKLSPAESIETGDWTSADWDLARKLYAILTSYLKGAALQLSRSGSDERNGFALWKTLIDHFAPQTRQRALALSQAISSYPAYKATGGKTLQEHIMGMETLVQQYDSLNSKQYDRDVLLGVLMRLCPEGIRQHLTLSIGETTSYQEVRERILSYERSSRLWSVDEMLKPLGKSDPSGVAPMEVDAVVKGKGKGHEKGKGKKGKGKGSSWSDGWNWFNSWSKGFGTAMCKVKREVKRPRKVERKGERQREAVQGKRKRKRETQSGSVPDMQWLWPLG